MAQLPHYLLAIDDSGDLGIQETSFVEYPATGLGFLAFEDEKIEHTFAKLDEQKYQRLVSGVLMMPKTKYLRQTAEGNFYTVEFTEETLKQALIKYLKEDKASVVKVEHKGRNLNGFAAVEHWIIEDATTKSPVLGNTLADLGYNPDDIPAGTIMKTTYVADEQFWNDQILSGKVSGYSLGGLFELKEVESEVQQFAQQPILPTVNDILKLIGGDNVSVTTKEGKELKFGETVTEGDEPAYGTYQFNTNLKVVIKEGVIVDYGYESSNTNTNFNEQQTTSETTQQPTVQVTTETAPNDAVTTQTTQTTTTDTTDTTAIVPELNIPDTNKDNELVSRLNEIEAKLADKDAKIAELEAKLAKVEEKNQNLKDKLKEEPIKKQPVTPKKTENNSRKTTLKIGNAIIEV